MKDHNIILREHGVVTRRVFLDGDDREWRVYMDEPTPGVPTVITVEHGSIVIDCREEGVNVSGDPDELKLIDLRGIIALLDNLRSEIDDQCI